MTILQETPIIDIKRLMQQIYVSEATLRRDLQKMENAGLIIRPHGKVKLAASFADKMLESSFRESFQNPIKKRLAETAIASCVKDGNVIMLDASSTAMNTVPFLSNYNNIIVITSGIKTALLLSETHIKFYSTGGRAINVAHSYVGQTAIDTLKNFNADVCFVSSRGLSEDGFVVDSSERENDVRYTIMKQSKRKVLLIDSSKINQGYWLNICHISEFDDVFCDQPLPEHIAKHVRNFHLIDNV
ncbi:MAG: DeoR/GlpR transcriptional regulator [Clostridia bacterium]|nr:DeoR/GlpR transcriptional regulator [Clostridia bacterium]